MARRKLTAVALVAPTSAALTIAVLGDFAVTCGGVPVTINSRKNRALIGILALSSQLSETRARLAQLLWSDCDGPHARSSLRQSLLALRRDLKGAPGEAVIVSEERVSLNRLAVEIDVKAFAKSAVANEANLLRQAAELYRGPVLADADVADPAFDDWLAPRRAEFLETAIRAMERLTELEAGPKQIATAQRLVALDPLREASHRTLMLACADQGDTGLALRQYDICARLLRQELDVEPATETQDLRRSIAGGADAGPGGQTERPSIAVLPFSGPSGDAAQQYLGDGLAEDLTVELARYRSLFVLASPTAFAVRDFSFNLAAVARRLKTQYLVTGALRQAPNEVRLIIQLVKAQNGQAVWAERFRGSAVDLPAFEDEVVRKIAARVEVQVASHERAILERRPVANWRAYDHVLRGRYELAQYEFAAAGEHFARAVTVDPQMSDAHAYRVLVLVVQSWTTGDPRDIDRARLHARQAVQCDVHNAIAHTAMAYVCQYGGELEAAGLHYQRAIDLNPNETRTLNYAGLWHCYMGEAAKGLALMDRALERDPHPNRGTWSMRANTLYQLGDYSGTVAAIDRMTLPPIWDIVYLIAALARLGDASSLRRLRASYGERLINDYAELVHHAKVEPYLRKEDKDHLLDGLQLARDGVQDPDPKTQQRQVRDDRRGA